MGIVITLVLCAVLLASQRYEFEVPLLDQLELKTYDMRLRALERSKPRHVTIAAIDEQSLARVGRWPWSRAVHAELARRLDEAGARVIAFDLFFPERESAKVDAQFARAVASTKKVVLGTVFLLDRSDAPYLGEAAAESGMRAMASQAFGDVQKKAELLADVPIRDAYGVIANIPELQRAAAYAGHINVEQDSDGVVRRTLLVMRRGDQYFPAFDLQVARAFAPDQPLSLELGEFGIRAVNVAGRHIPVDERGKLLVRYRGPEGKTFDTVSIADILERKADPKLLRDRIVLIGSTAQGTGDIRVTPYGTRFPGVEVRASIIENLLEGEVLVRPDWMTLVDVAMMVIIGLLMIWLLPRLGVSGGGLLAAVLFGAYLAFATYLFRSEGLWLNLVYPSLLIALLFSCATLVSYFFAFSEKRYLKLAFQHYVPPAVVEDLVADAGALRLGGEKRELTVLFSDIRGFTALSEGLPPEELVKLMNEYFTVMTERVFAHRGSLDKYIGDAIMAVYGAPVAENEHPAQACRSALDMLRALDELQQKWRPAGLPTIGIGVGINTGQMVVGNMGSATRFNYTVVGDAVNLASRIESLNKTYGTSILISEYTYERVKGELGNVREVDSVRVRGREQPVRLYELFPEGKFTVDFLEQYRQAYAAMNAGDYARSAPMFEQLHASTGDGVSAFHAQRRGPDRRWVGESTIMS